MEVQRDGTVIVWRRWQFFARKGHFMRMAMTALCMRMQIALRKTGQQDAQDHQAKQRPQACRGTGQAVPEVGDEGIHRDSMQDAAPQNNPIREDRSAAMPSDQRSRPSRPSGSSRTPGSSWLGARQRAHRRNRDARAECVAAGAGPWSGPGWRRHRTPTIRPRPIAKSRAATIRCTCCIVSLVR